MFKPAKLKPSLFLLCLLLLLALASASPAETPAATLNIMDYGAIPDDGRDDQGAINTALDLARGGMTAAGTGTVTVVIPAGTWNVSSPLYIYSDTVLKAESGAVISSSIQDGPILTLAHINPATGQQCTGSGCTHGGYSKGENITVEGGTWIAPSGASGDTCIIGFHHCRGVSIRNLTCKNMTGHAINLSGVDGGTVSGCTIQDQHSDWTSEGDYLKESIHLDYCTEAGEPYFGVPYDGTPSKNITVSGCAFRNVDAGVGNHHGAPSGGTVTSGITVKNCTFTNVQSYCVMEHAARNLTVSGCTVSETPMLALLMNVTGLSVSGNTVDCGSRTYPFIEKQTSEPYTPIYLTRCGSITVADNTVQNTLYGAVKVYTMLDAAEGEKNVFSGNILTNITGVGLELQQGTNVQVTGNKLTGVSENGIFFMYPTGAVLSDNTVESTGGNAVGILGKESKPGTVTVTGNTLCASSAEKYDLYLSKYADCQISGNTLQNFTFFFAGNAKYTADFAPIGSVEVDDAECVYTGEELHPAVTVKDTNGRVLTVEKDYTLVYSRCVNAGSTAEVKVKGTGNTMFADQLIRQNFTIQPKAVTPELVLSQKTYTFNNKAQKPAVTVNLDGSKLPKEAYTVTYPAGRKNVGTYTVTITLKKNYSGTASDTFEIVKAPNPAVIKAVKTQTVTGTAKRAKILAFTKFLTMEKAKGTKTFSLKKAGKYLSIDKKTGKITVAKGTPAGTYSFTIVIKLSGDKNYLSKTIKQKLKVIVK